MNKRQREIKEERHRRHNCKSKALETSTRDEIQIINGGVGLREKQVHFHLKGSKMISVQ